MVQRIDSSTAVSQLPPLATTGTGTPGFFTEGDPATGSGATVVTADWLNGIQEEIISVIVAAGLTPDKTNRAQLLEAIKKFIPDASKFQPVGDYLPMAGGTLSGSLHANGSEGVFGNTLFGGKLSSGIDGRPENSYLQTQISNGNPLTIVGQQGAPGGDWHNWVFDPSDGSITSPNGNKFAQQTDLTAERNRAEAAESGMLPLSGGNLTGDLTLTGNTWQNNLYGRTLHSKADASPIDAALQLVGTRDNPVLSLRTVNESGGWQQWSFNSATGNVVSPGGGVLPEVLGMNGRVVIQNFIATVSAEQGTINFPNAFKPGTSPFVICVATTEPGTNFRGMTAVRQDANRNLQITNIGFDYFIYNGTNTSRSVPVLAIGIM